MVVQWGDQVLITFWSEPEMLRSNIVGERLNSGDEIVGVSIKSTPSIT